MYSYGKSSFVVLGVSCDECPVDYITPQTEADLNVYFRTKRVSGIAGAALYGPDLSKWPARQVDILDLMEIEAIRFDEARSESERAAR